MSQPAGYPPGVDHDAQSQVPPRHDPAERPIGEHDQHRGRLSSWIVVGVVIVGFAAGGIALMTHLWVLFAVCIAIVLAAIPAALAVHILDDTVTEGIPALLPADQSPFAADTGSAADPRVDIGAPPAGGGARVPPNIGLRRGHNDGQRGESLPSDAHR